MAFDPSLDKVVWSESVEFDKSRITVSVIAYNDGAPKLQISRENKSAEGEYRFAKLGRMFKNEAVAVAPLIQKALSHM